MTFKNIRKESPDKEALLQFRDLMVKGSVVEAIELAENSKLPKSKFKTPGNIKYAKDFIAKTLLVIQHAPKNVMNSTRDLCNIVNFFDKPKEISQSKEIKTLATQLSYKIIENFVTLEHPNKKNGRLSGMILGGFSRMLLDMMEIANIPPKIMLKITVEFLQSFIEKGGDREILIKNREDIGDSMDSIASQKHGVETKNKPSNIINAVIQKLTEK
jgi:hypothetical protein